MTKPGKAEAQRPQPEDGKLVLSLSADSMALSASVTPPRHGGAAVTVEQVMEAIAERKICFGIDDEAIAELVVAGAAGARAAAEGMVIARGEPPVNGQDGEIIPHELLQTPSGYPCVRDDGTVDFFELSMVRNVKAGVTLAVRKPPTGGKNGTDVLGRPVPARPGRDVRLRAGTGAVLSPDGQSIVSTTEGHAYMNAYGEIAVSPVFTVKNVDFSTGNIDFVGTVVVLGDIGPGFQVKAGKSVEVHGAILSGAVEAGGDVTVRCGIVGGGRSRVVAGGNVQCRFVEGAEIEAAGDVRVEESILSATVRAGGSIYAAGPRGRIIGGQLWATGEVKARVLGSSYGTVTVIQVGLHPDVRLELEQLRQALERAETQLRQCANTIASLRRLPALNPRQRSLLDRAVRVQHKARADRERLTADLSGLMSRIGDGSSGRVLAIDVAYPGVRIVIGAERHFVLEPCERCCFFLNPEGEVTVAPA